MARLTSEIDAGDRSRFDPHRVEGGALDGWTHDRVVGAVLEAWAKARANGQVLEAVEGHAVRWAALQKRWMIRRASGPELDHRLGREARRCFDRRQLLALAAQSERIGCGRSAPSGLRYLRQVVEAPNMQARGDAIRSSWQQQLAPSRLLIGHATLARHARLLRLVDPGLQGGRVVG